MNPEQRLLALLRSERMDLSPLPRERGSLHIAVHPRHRDGDQGGCPGRRGGHPEIPPPSSTVRTRSAGRPEAGSALALSSASNPGRGMVLHAVCTSDNHLRKPLRSFERDVITLPTVFRDENWSKSSFGALMDLCQNYNRSKTRFKLVRPAVH